MSARFVAHSFVFILACTGLALAPLHAAKPWPAPIPEELAAKASTIEPDATVEVLAREETNDCDRGEIRSELYFRLKVFTKAGAEKLSKIEISYEKGSGSVSGIEARTIRPDGTILTLKPSDVFDREFVRMGSVRGRMKSFAPPGVEPGVIVEYRYRRVQSGWWFVTPFVFQSEHPTRSVVYRYRPMDNLPGLSMQVLFFNYPTKELKPNRAGFYEFSLTNIGSHKQEPMQPPAIHLQPGILIYYSGAAPKTPEEYWVKLSEQLHETTLRETKVTKAIAAETQRRVAAGDSDDDKLRKLHDFCRGTIVNREREGTGLTKEQREKLPTNDRAHDTLKHGAGTASDINTLFVALAKAAGFDARLALANDRTNFVYFPTLPVPFAFIRRVAAVRRGDTWQYFDPGASYLPAGMLDWRNGDTSILVANEKGALILPAQSAPAERSRRRQTATLTVQDDGSLEGDVKLDFTGYYEAAEKGALDAATPDELEKHFVAALEPHLKGAEITALKVEHASHPIEPVKVSFHLRVPEFAERTGSRLFVQPSVFRRAGKALFESARRQTSMLFPHRYEEVDEVALTLPAGAEIEAGSSPQDIDLGAVASYSVTITWGKTQRLLSLRREFHLGVLGFPRESYEKVKRLFEIIQEQDDHTLTFRLAAPTAAETAGEGGAQ